MKNLFKMYKNLSVAAVLFTVFLFFSCSGSVNSTTSDSNASYNISGSLAFEGAASSSLLQSSSSRTAIPSFTNMSVTPVGSVKATCDGKTVTGIFSLSTMKYSIDIPNPGKWILDVSVKTGDKAFLKIKEDGSNNVLNISTGSSAVTKNIIMQPVSYDTLTGNINLTIKDDSKKLYKVNYSNLEKDINTDKYFTNNSVDINISDVPAGSYELTFTFDDEAGNTLYTCREVINVFSGFTTDTWYGNSTYIKNGEFVISESLVSNYGTQAVPNTGLVLSDYYDGFYDDVNKTNKIGESSCVAYCFDLEGNTYIAEKQNIDSIDWFIIHSKKTGFPDDGIKLSSEMDEYNSNILVDFSSDIMYGYKKSGSSILFYKYPTLISDNIENADTTITYSATALYEGTEVNIRKCVIYDDVIYALCQNSGDYNFYMIEFNIASADGDNVLTAQSAVLLNIPVEVNYYVKISDILYQDDMIYLLLNNSTDGFSSREIYSRGCVLIYNTLTHMLTSDIVGWAEGIANTSAFKTGTQVGEYGDYLLYESYTDQYDKSTGTPLIYDFSNSSSQCSLYTSYNNNDSCFAGPKQFVAIKPKKLVISDRGVAFYTDKEGVLKYKNVNRVVYVDLESLSITKEEESECAFASGYASVTGVNVYSSETTDISGCYRWNESAPAHFAQVTTSYANLYVRFIKGE